MDGQLNPPSLSHAAELASTGSVAMITVDESCRFVIEVGSGQEAEEGLSRQLAAGVFPSSYRILLQELRRLAPAGGRVLDLGAHIGVFSLAAAAVGYQVVAVEASPRNASLLRTSISRNGFEHLRVVEAGVADRPGRLEFCPFGPYGHVATEKASTLRTIEVPAVTVDGLLEELGWDRVDFIKMDIEGSEVAAIRGMSRILRRPNAPPIFFESNRHTLGFYDHTPADLKAALAAHGYRLSLVSGGELIPTQPEDEQVDMVVDYLATKTSRESMISRIFRRLRRAG